MIVMVTTDKIKAETLVEYARDTEGVEFRLVTGAEIYAVHVDVERYGVVLIGAICDAFNQEWRVR